MSHATSSVKSHAGNKKAAWLVWIDAHPRTGWYVLCVVTADVVLNLLNLTQCPLLG